MLLIDAGNTRIKAAFAGDLGRNWAVAKQDGNTAGVVSSLLDQCHRQPNQVVVSCVGDSDCAEQLHAQCSQRWGLEPLRLRATEEFGGVINGYADHRQLGVDRWAAIVQAWRMIRGAAVVVDCGTAITVDTIAANGRHLGGVIFPGLRLSATSFYRHTKNQEFESGTGRELYASDTTEAVASGVFWSVTGGINAILKKLLEQLPVKTPVLLTGGDAAELSPYLYADTQWVEHLVFDGMAWLAGFPQEEN